MLSMGEVPNPPEALAPAEGSAEVTSTQSSQNDVLMPTPGVAQKGFVSVPLNLSPQPLVLDQQRLTCFLSISSSRAPAGE